MKKYDIALYPGDGIGIEVMTEAKKVLNTVADKFGFSEYHPNFHGGTGSGKSMERWYLMTF